MERERPRGIFRRVLRYRDFRLLFTGFAISQAGDWLYNAALIAFVLEETGSAGWIAAASIIRLAPFVLFGAIGGDIGDRWDRRRVMIVADLVRAGLMAALAVVAATHAPVGVALVLVFLSSAASTTFEPAAEATIPSVVTENDLAPANAALGTIENAAIAVGPAIGGILILLGPVYLAFGFNGLSFLASAACVSALSVRSPIAVEAEGTSLRRRILDGVRTMSGSPGVGVIVLLICGAAFIYGEEIVLLALVSDELLGIGSEGVGFLLAAIGVGGILAAGITSRLAEHPRPGQGIALATVALGAPLVALAWTRVPVVAYIIMAASGAGGIASEVVAITMLQRLVPENFLARVFGLLSSLAVAGMIAGSLVAPALVTVFGLETTLIVTGSLLPVLVALSFPRLQNLEKKTSVVTRDLQPIVDTLRGLGIFEGAPVQTLELLARGIGYVHVKPGQIVIREGDSPDHLYVVRTGTLDVYSTRGGVQPAMKVNSLTEGDYFGEIGLVNRVPRTATVEAASEVDLYRIEGENFIQAVGHTPVSRVLVRDIAARLERSHPGSPKETRSE
jgi:MFS family permease